MPNRGTGRLVIRMVWKGNSDGKTECAKLPLSDGDKADEREDASAHNSSEVLA